MDAALMFFVIGGIVFLFIFLYFFPISLWITARVSGVSVGLFEMVFMRIRKVPVRVVVDSLITATKAGLKVTSTDLETHYLPGAMCQKLSGPLSLPKKQTSSWISNKPPPSIWQGAMCLKPFKSR
jgi:uncharacterized protein YqfA (UPF0365 family)